MLFPYVHLLSFSISCSSLYHHREEVTLLLLFLFFFLIWLTLAQINVQSFWTFSDLFLHCIGSSIARDNQVLSYTARVYIIIAKSAHYYCYSFFYLVNSCSNQCPIFLDVFRFISTLYRFLYCKR